MKKIIIKEEEEDVIKLNEIDTCKHVIATYVPDSNSEHKTYFLSGTSNSCCFTNLYGFSLGGYRSLTQEEAIERRTNGTDVPCKPTEVYVFKSIKEAIKKLGE